MVSGAETTISVVMVGGAKTCFSVMKVRGDDDVEQISSAETDVIS